MTVVSAVITRHCTAHATDSLLTELMANGKRKIREDRKPKLVSVRRWRGAMTFWGLAQYGKWSTLDWLRKQAAAADEHNSAEEFATRVATHLNEGLVKLHFPNPVDGGIGIHFTTYERINDYWIPELFLISNWKGIPYTDIRPEGVGISRETFHTLKDVPSVPEHRNSEYRLEVHRWLHEKSGMFRYNNGDPELFNPVANAILDTFFTIMKRGSLKSSTSKTHCDIARRPIEVISRVLGDFSRKGTRLIGGKLHDLSVSPHGTYWSSTGGT